MRTFLATLIGIVIAMGIMMGLQMLGHTLFPVPIEINPNDTESIRINMDLIPTASLIMVIVAHSLGQLGGLLTAKLIDTSTKYPIYIIAGFLMLGTVANLASIPHPVWFAIVDVLAMILIALPFVLTKSK